MRVRARALPWPALIPHQLAHRREGSLQGYKGSNRSSCLHTSCQSATGRPVIDKSVLCRSSGDGPGRACCDERHAKHQRYGLQRSHLQHRAQDCPGRARHDRFPGRPPGALARPATLALPQQAPLCGSQMFSAYMVEILSQRLCLAISWPLPVPGCEMAIDYTPPQPSFCRVRTLSACRGEG